MKKSLLLVIILILSTVLFTQKTNANIILSFEPSSQDVVLGNQAVVDIVISGLGDHSSPSVGGFDFYVLYDPTVLTFDHYILGDQLGDNIQDPFSCLFDSSCNAEDWSLGELFPSTGIINLGEVSLLSSSELNSNQPSSFTLATLYFDTIAYGSSNFEFYFECFSYISDEYGLPLDVTLQSGTVNVVPEPTTLLLMGAGFAGLGFLRKKKNQLF